MDNSIKQPKYGYLFDIDGERQFIVAENIAAAINTLGGKKWELVFSQSFPISYADPHTQGMEEAVVKSAEDIYNSYCKKNGFDNSDLPQNVWYKKDVIDFLRYASQFQASRHTAPAGSEHNLAVNILQAMDDADLLVSDPTPEVYADYLKGIIERNKITNFDGIEKYFSAKNKLIEQTFEKLEKTNPRPVSDRIDENLKEHSGVQENIPLAVKIIDVVTDIIDGGGNKAFLIESVSKVLQASRSKGVGMDAEAVMKFLEEEKGPLGMSDHKTIDRIMWYLKTYFIKESAPLSDNSQEEGRERVTVDQLKEAYRAGIVIRGYELPNLTIEELVEKYFKNFLSSISASPGSEGKEENRIEILCRQSYIDANTIYKGVNIEDWWPHFKLQNNIG